MHNRIRLSEVSGRESHLDLVRLLAAVLVIVSHSYPLTGTAEPLKTLTGVAYGTVAVDVFFITSGFLVTGSLAARQSLIDFVASRVLRVYPGLIVMTLLTVTAIGVAVGPGFFFAPETWAYVRANAFIGLRQLTLTWLPGVFPNNPMPEVVNGSLWTLPFELRMYAILALGWLAMGIFKARRLGGFKIAIVVIALTAAASRFAMPDSMMVRCLFMFFTGAAAALYKERVVVDGRIAIGCAVLLAVAAAISQPAFFVLYSFCLAYLLAAFAFLPRLWRPSHDYSYGIYIYAFPIQQAVVAVFPHLSPLQVTFATLPPVVFAAALSWHLVEARGMAAKAVLRNQRPTLDNLQIRWRTALRRKWRD